eukprot:TRINITY_DN13980_c0_g1_i1.p1 TRINITY_DN13980_c0_g1~~TRINITY_DN13980_c0_g1_i1.p1  ORF type:complete len:177 (+),score=33.24 TRINITY_DN13980_c0_g1_i1:138-668(+)
MDWAAARMRYKMGAAVSIQDAHPWLCAKLSEPAAPQESSKGGADHCFSPSTVTGGGDLQAHLQRLEAELIFERQQHEPSLKRDCSLMRDLMAVHDQRILLEQTQMDAERRKREWAELQLAELQLASQKESFERRTEDHVKNLRSVIAERDSLQDQVHAYKEELAAVKRELQQLKSE